MRLRYYGAIALLLVLAMPLAAQDETLYVSSFEPTEALDVSVDSTLTPVIQSQPGFDGGADRPLALMHTDLGNGYSFHFVENEIYLITDDPQDLVALQSRWPSTVLVEVDLDVFDTGATQDRLYLLEVDPSAADPGRIRDNLEGLIPELAGTYSVSSETALRTLALAAIEIGDHGLRVGINPVLETDTVARRSTEEAASGDPICSGGDDPPSCPGALLYTYARDAFEWPFAKRESQLPSSYPLPLNTGAAEAVRLVNAGVVLFDKVRVMIADAGFFPNEDFPPFDIVNGLRGDNPVCEPNRPVCDTHGTHVTLTGFARIDDSFGTFGPGGEVSELLLLQSPSLDLAGFIRYLTEGVREFELDPPEIINISSSISVAGGWCFLACEPLDVVISILRANGTVVVASAGNDSLDVDAMDRFCIGFCAEFEEAAIIPCELDGVLCVGATTPFQSLRTGYSNFGSSGGDGNSVDLYAPGNLYSVDALAADSNNAMPNDDLQVVTGTSFAAPFAAGVLSLTMAADPGSTAIQAENCLISRAFQPFGGSSDFRSIDAAGAVACAMGGSHPFVEIVAPFANEQFFRGLENLALFANVDDYEQGSALTVQWTSSLDGSLGSSASGASLDPGLISMEIGNHEICARVTDNSSRSALDCVDIVVRSAPPSVEWQQPAQSASFIVSSPITLSATTSDLDGPAPSGSDVEWYLYPVGGGTGSPTATGLSAVVPGGTFSPGSYTVNLQVTDSDGESASLFRTIIIEADPPNVPPRVTITSPGNGDTVLYDNQPVRFVIEATVVDPEDVTIPFTAIDWEVSVAGGAFQDVELETQQFCFTPPGGFPQCGQITYYLDLEPLPGRSSTEFIIRPSVTDSGGISNNGENEQISVFITQLL